MKYEYGGVSLSTTITTEGIYFSNHNWYNGGDYLNDDGDGCDLTFNRWELTNYVEY